MTFVFYLPTVARDDPLCIDGFDFERAAMGSFRRRPVNRDG